MFRSSTFHFAKGFGFPHYISTLVTDFLRFALFLQAEYTVSSGASPSPPFDNI